MNLMRWNDPFAGVTTLHQDLDDLFNDLWTKPLTQASMPVTDMYTEDDKRLVTEMHLPGFNKEDVDVSVHEGYLEIRGEKKEEKEKDTKKRYMLRQSAMSFYRRFALPKNADGNAVEAEFENGLLKVVVPFKELPTPKKISIKSSKK